MEWNIVERAIKTDRHKNRIKRSGQAWLVYVCDINRNIPTTRRWARGDLWDSRHRPLNRKRLQSVSRTFKSCSQQRPNTHTRTHTRARTSSLFKTEENRNSSSENQSPSGETSLNFDAFVASLGYVMMTGDASTNVLLDWVQLPRYFPSV